MYAGKVLEKGTAKDIFHHPQHPYTLGLLKSLPRTSDDKTTELSVIDGQPPDLLYDIKGCPFMPRCPHAMKICERESPPPTEVENSDLHDHYVNCWLLHKTAVEGGIQ